MCLYEACAGFSDTQDTTVRRRAFLDADVDAMKSLRGSLDV